MFYIKVRVGIHTSMYNRFEHLSHPQTQAHTYYLYLCIPIYNSWLLSDSLRMNSIKVFGLLLAVIR